MQVSDSNGVHQSLADGSRLNTSDSVQLERSEIRHIIVSLVESGLSIFYECLSGLQIDPDLFSALLTASFLVREVEGLDRDSDHDIYELEGQVAHICYGEYLAGIAVAEGAIDTKTMNRLKRFIQAYEAEYGFLLTNWDGDRSFFDHDWASRQLHGYMGVSDQLYLLHPQATERTINARQIRLLLLIKRFAASDPFDVQSLCKYLEEKLILSIDIIEEILSELERSGIITPYSSP